MTPRTLRDLRAEGLPGFRPDGTVDLDLLWPAYLSRKATKLGSSDLRGQKLQEEIRKLKLANEQKAGRLVERAWVAEKMQRCAGDLNKMRAKWEAEAPVKLAAAGDDVAKNREALRPCFDEIFSDIQSLARHFDESPTA